MHDLILKFENHLVHEKNASPHTVRAYLSDLRELEDYLSKNGIAIERAPHTAIRGHLGVLAAGHAASSRARKLACIKSFYRFLRDTGLSEVNPARRLKTPKLPERLPKVLPVD